MVAESFLLFNNRLKLPGLSVQFLFAVLGDVMLCSRSFRSNRVWLEGSKEVVVQRYLHFRQ